MFSFFCFNVQDGLLVENMHDIPYMNRKTGPEITASMTTVCGAVKSLAGGNIPCGVQILSGCNQEALAVAKVTIRECKFMVEKANLRNSQYLCTSKGASLMIFFDFCFSTLHLLWPVRIF